MTSIDEPLTVLLVEDSPQDVELTKYALSQAGIPFDVNVAQRLSIALDAVVASPPDVVLLDLGLPDACDMEGVQALQRHAPTTPIVVLSGSTEQRAALEALESGAQDYVVKGNHTPDVLARAIRYAIERKRSERELLQAARFDALTGLANRPYFLGLLDHALERARRNHTSVDVLFLDLDRFKNVNDSLGHAAGDDLLRQVAERLRACVRVSDVVARLGGDEFTVMIEAADSPRGPAHVADKILNALQAPFQVSGVEAIVTPSIGIAGFPDAGADAATVLQHADTAMYSAKARGRNTIEFFTKAMNAAVRQAFGMEMALRRAVTQNAFQLHYQPILDRATEHVTGVEALLRWQRDGAGDVLSPGAFLPTLERVGLMPQVGDWVLHAACAQCRRWQLSLRPDLRVAVNVSPRQLANGLFVDRVREVLTETGLPARALSIEITEEVLLTQSADNLKALHELRLLGVGVAIDDFGSGYSSLSYLTSFPFDTVKIDRTFIERVEERGERALITAGILSIARGLGRRVIAEGVETEAQLDFLTEHACREVQGFLFSPPLAPSVLEGIWTRRGRWNDALAARSSVLGTPGRAHDSTTIGIA